MNAITTKNGKEVTLKSLASSEKVQKKFREALGDKAPAYIQSVVTTAQNSPALMNVNPMSIFSCAMHAACARLSVIPAIGQAAIVPYGDKAQYQIMVRGYVQLAQRTGLYKTINAGEVYEDEYDGEDLLTGEVTFHRVKGGYRDNGQTDKIVGYFAYIETITGFSKTEYWTKADVQNHARRFSKSWKTGPWKDHFDAMARKTVLKSLLTHYGPMSVDSDLAQAIGKDQIVVDDRGNEGFDDNPFNDYNGPTNDFPEQEVKTIPPTAENATTAEFDALEPAQDEEPGVPDFNF